MRAVDWELYWRKWVPNILDKIYRILLWPHYQRFLDDIGKRDLNILEMGCGLGLNTLRMVKMYGGTATLMDYCDYALARAGEAFKKEGIPVTLIKRDVLTSDPPGDFELVLSDGLVEHFYDEDRAKVFEAHVKAAKKDGYILIYAPHKNRAYQIIRGLLAKLGLWRVEEEPLLENEIPDLAKRYDLKLIGKNKFMLYWRGFLMRKGETVTLPSRSRPDSQDPSASV